MTKKKILFAAVFLAVIGFSATAVDAAAANLIANPDLEVADSAGFPVDWTRGRWGTNSVTFTYPVAGSGGGKAAKVAISQYTSGDAKWVPKEAAVTPGLEYEFSDMYISNVQTHITLEFKMSNGSFVYQDIASPPAQSSFAQATARFTAPAGAVSARVFHLIKQVGILSVDKYDLHEIAVPAPVSCGGGNLVPNCSFENLNSSGQPSDWFKGRWGTNSTTFSFPVAGNTGSRAAKIAMTSYSTGDAKWYFSEVPTSGGKAYDFSDFYRSDIRTFVTVQFRLSNGTFKYVDIGSPAASSAWTKFTSTVTAPAGAVGLTVFHVIKGIGFLEVDDYSLIEKTPTSDPTRFSTGLVSIDFDDGNRDMFDNALPIINNAGFKTTHYIVSGYIGFPAYITGEEVLKLQAQGHEIGGHTRTHANVTTLSESAARAEIGGGRSDLRALGANPVDFFAYPFGAYNSSVIQYVKDAGFLGARTTDGGYNFKNQDLYTLKRQNLTNTTTFAQVKSYIDTAMADKTWLILVAHHVNNSGEQYSITPALLQQIVDYLKQQNITPITMSQGLTLIKN